MSDELALLGGEPVRTEPFPWDLKKNNIGEIEESLVMGVLKERNLSPFYKNPHGGKRVQMLEDTFAHLHSMNYNGERHFFAVACNSGTAALHMAYAALGIGCNDEVIVPSYTFIATATAAMHHNAIPVFADVSLDTFNIEPIHVEPLITKRTKAIALVPVLGNPCDMGLWLEWLEDYNERHKRKIVLLEDAAQSMFAKYDGRYVGTFGKIATYSLQHTKTITSGEGGLVLTDDYQLAERCRLIRNHGETQMDMNMPREYLSHILGWNYRMCEIEAALAFGQLLQVNEFTTRQQQNAEFLNQAFFDIFNGKWVPQAVYDEAENVYSLYGTRLVNMGAIKRSTIIAALAAEGITATTGYPRPIYDNPIFKQATAYGNGCPFGCWGGGGVRGYQKYIRHLINPNTETLCRGTAIWFDLHRYPATQTDMEDIKSALQKISEGADELYKYQLKQEAIT